MVPEVIDILHEMEDLHIKKSAGYGSNQDPLHNFNAVAKGAGLKNYHYPILRCMEKLTRAANLLEAGRDDELEEEFKDVALLMVLAEAMRRQSKCKEIEHAKSIHEMHPGRFEPIELDIPEDIRNVLAEPNCPTDDQIRELKDERLIAKGFEPRSFDSGDPKQVRMLDGTLVIKSRNYAKGKSASDKLKKDSKIVVRTSYPLGKENE